MTLDMMESFLAASGFLVESRFYGVEGPHTCSGGLS
jgi:hypothetical protein